MFNRKLKKEYNHRLNGEIEDIITEANYYEVHGSRKIFKLKSGKYGVFELISWLPFEEPGVKYGAPETASWMMLCYKGDVKTVYEMSFREFKSFRKELKRNKDVL